MLFTLQPTIILSLISKVDMQRIIQICQSAAYQIQPIPVKAQYKWPHTTHFNRGPPHT